MCIKGGKTNLKVNFKIKMAVAMTGNIDGCDARGVLNKLQ